MVQVNGVRQPFELEQHSVDATRSMKVIGIGAGINGVLAAVKMPRRIHNLELVIYEKNPEVGGTWYENRYPGVACDIPAHSYQLTFEPNSQWSQFYASGPEILKYWKHVALKYNAYKYIRLSHQCVGAKWNEAESKWHVQIRNLETGEQFEDTCDIFYPCMGFLNNWKWPDIPGLHSFKGKLMHSANWDASVDLSNENIAVIGVGSSAIQIVPSLQRICKRVDSYVRGRTWIATPFAPGSLAGRNPTGANHQFSEEELARFRADPAYYNHFRRDLERELNAVHGGTIKESDMQKFAVHLFTENMKQKLAKKPEIFDSLLPNFPVAARRLTPGPGFLESLTEENVEFITTPIEKITEDGVVDVDGKLRKVDGIICATGFDVSGKPRFELIGQGGRELSADWGEYPLAYMSLAVNGYPNLFMQAGPNVGVGSGSLTVIFERICDYTIHAIKKMQRERIASMVVKSEAVQDWDDYMQAYFPKTVFSSKVRSWYKNGKEEGRVVALWPGSCLHALRTLEYPRWEDYDYKYMDNRTNRLGYLGDGWTEIERSQGDTGFYLDEAELLPVDEQEALNQIKPIRT